MHPKNHAGGTVALGVLCCSPSPICLSCMPFRDEQIVLPGQVGDLDVIRANRIAFGCRQDDGLVGPYPLVRVDWPSPCRDFCGLNVQCRLGSHLDGTIGRSTRRRYSSWQSLCSPVRGPYPRGRPHCSGRLCPPLRRLPAQQSDGSPGHDKWAHQRGDQHHSCSCIPHTGLSMRLQIIIRGRSLRRCISLLNKIIDKLSVCN